MTEVNIVGKAEAIQSQPDLAETRQLGSWRKHYPDLIPLTDFWFTEPSSSSFAGAVTAYVRREIICHLADKSVLISGVSSRFRRNLELEDNMISTSIRRMLDGVLQSSVPDLSQNPNANVKIKPLRRLATSFGFRNLPKTIIEKEDLSKEELLDKAAQASASGLIEKAERLASPFSNLKEQERLAILALGHLTIAIRSGEFPPDPNTHETSELYLQNFFADQTSDSQSEGTKHLQAGLEYLAEALVRTYPPIKSFGISSQFLRECGF